MNQPRLITDSSPLEVLRIGGLWSLDDVLRFYANSYAAAIGVISRVAMVVSFSVANGNEEDEGDRQNIREALTGDIFEKLPLSQVVRLQYERMVKAIDNQPTSALLVMLRELVNNFHSDLAEHYFLMIPKEQRHLYDNPPNEPFGNAVALAFPSAGDDILAAGRCLALDEPTACVFHSMRVLEHGLRAMAVKLGIPPATTALENWKNVIDQMEKAIKDQEALPKSPAKSEMLKNLSGCAVQFRYFKDAWRNHVSHSHESYGPEQASSIYSHVRSFVVALAAWA